MNPDGNYQRLFLRSLLALGLCSVAVWLCFLYVDEPVARLVCELRLGREFPVLRYLTYPPPYLQQGAPLVLIALMLRRTFDAFRRWELVLLAACVSLLVSIEFKELLKFACGRTWPDTWVHNNPSLLRDNVYGFFPFHGGEGYASFPSGHTSRMVAIVAVYWCTHPWWRWLGVLATVLVVVGLIGMNYHFVGDTVGGGVVGGLVGVYTAYFFGLLPAQHEQKTLGT